MEGAGRVNCYICEGCGAQHFTINVVNGTTPFMMKCRAVGGCHNALAMSSFYAVAQNHRPQWEWYKPEGSELEAAEPAVKDHVTRGGLMPRRVTPETLERFGFGHRAG